MELPFDVEAAEKALTSADPLMGEVIATYGPCAMTITPFQSPFESLFRTIIYQQLSTVSANAIYGRVLALFEGKVPTPEATLDMAADAFREVGMSRQKIKYAQDLAQKTLEGTVPEMTALAHLS
ncbi:MAG: DNA-3-methyladenine glycosylase 2 family protein, partial [Bacteroidota bacterium]